MTPLQQRNLVNALTEHQMRSVLAYLSGLAPREFDAAAVEYGLVCTLCRNVGHPATEPCLP